MTYPAKILAKDPLIDVAVLKIEEKNLLYLELGDSDTIDLGEEVSVEVTFDPAAHGPSGVGPIERQVVISTGANQQPISLQFKAVVTP